MRRDLNFLPSVGLPDMHSQPLHRWRRLRYKVPKSSAQNTFAAYYTIDNAPLHLYVYVTRATPLCYTYAHTYGVPWYSVPHTLGILGMALRIWLRVSSSGPTVEAWPHPGIISTTACGTICCKNCDV